MSAGATPMTFLRRRRRMPLVNVAPLIDVLFLLLIFFMVSTTFKTQPGLKIDLPVARSANPVRTDSLTLLISAKGEFYLQGRWVPRADLRQALGREARRSGRRPLVIEVDRDIPAGLLVMAMDTAQEAGFSRVVLPTADAETP